LNRTTTLAMDRSTDSHHNGDDNEPELSPIEQEVLDEYAKLVGNLDNVRPSSYAYWHSLTPS